MPMLAWLISKLTGGITTRAKNLTGTAKDGTGVRKRARSFDVVEYTLLAGLIAMVAYATLNGHC
jgi:hypothetical protein